MKTLVRAALIVLPVLAFAATARAVPFTLPGANGDGAVREVQVKETENYQIVCTLDSDPCDLDSGVLYQVQVFRGPNYVLEKYLIRALSDGVVRIPSETEPNDSVPTTALPTLFYVKRNVCDGERDCTALCISDDDRLRNLDVREVKAIGGQCAARGADNLGLPIMSIFTSESELPTTSAEDFGGRTGGYHRCSTLAIATSIEVEATCVATYGGQ